MKPSRLKSSLEKRRAFEQRGRESSARAFSGGGNGREGERSRAARNAEAAIPAQRVPKKQRQKKTRTRSQLPALKGWSERVFKRYGGWCVVCAAEGRARSAASGHHVVPVRVILRQHCSREITQEQRERLVGDETNGIPVCDACHHRHESAFKRIPRALLGAERLAWAVEQGFGWFVDDERVYP